MTEGQAVDEKSTTTGWKAGGKFRAKLTGAPAGDKRGAGGEAGGEVDFEYSYSSSRPGLPSGPDTRSGLPHIWGLLPPASQHHFRLEAAFGHLRIEPGLPHPGTTRTSDPFPGSPAGSTIP
ncbi:hypothetical protein [Streptomyces rimosus]|uniref:hypothetical protein n=1 Tax=Streptomyces rimosus TaxID=1927 RepID=UPI0037D63D83